jgi:hypothetical protein
MFSPATLIVISNDVRFTKDAIFYWDDQFTDLAQSGLSGVDMQGPPSNRFIIGLTHIRSVGADKVKMGSRGEPFASNQRGFSHGGTRDQVCTRNGCGKIIDWFNTRELSLEGFSEYFGPFCCSVPYLDMLA